LNEVIERLQAGVEAGSHLGAQACVIHRGEVVLDVAVGESRPGTAMETDTLTLWMSAGKPLTALLAARLVARGLLDVGRPVVAYVPDFAANGKDGVTVAHLLTHTGGFRNVSSNWSASPWPDVIRRINEATLEDDWTPGEAAGYHVASGWYVLAEVCRVVAGVPATDAAVTKLLRDEVCLPLGMSDAWIGMPRHRFVDYGTRLGLAFDMSTDERKPLGFANSERGFTLCRPGGNARGPASQLAMMYQRLLACLRGKDDFLPADVAATFTGRRRSGLRDLTFKADLDWGYGFLLADLNGRSVPYGYGPHASPAAFGHSGNRSSCAFADPEHDLAVAWITNGLPSELVHQKRQHALNAAMYESLGLAS
jgi:CubicO group peptidase (beta-lactamase class C family)